MKIFLAGCEGYAFAHLVEILNHKNILFSYYHINKGDKNMDLLKNSFNNKGFEMICDSGLFTLMFGAGKGQTHDIASMTEYTKKYIQWAQTNGLTDTTYVESDVHKLLGMPAVFELRKHFEESGLKVMYVWHREEGIDGLMTMAKKYDYIAISVPELRKLFKAHDWKYQDGVFDLLNKIRREVTTMPKIHLLGNTVQHTMETPLAYSCDSTSWLSGGRWGRVIVFENGRLFPIERKSAKYRGYVVKLREHFQEFAAKIELHTKDKDKGNLLEYMTSNYISAQSLNLFEQHLNKHYPWIGLSEGRFHAKQSEYHDSTYRLSGAKPMEPEQTI